MHTFTGPIDSQTGFATQYTKHMTIFSVLNEASPFSFTHSIKLLEKNYNSERQRRINSSYECITALLFLLLALLFVCLFYFFYFIHKQPISIRLILFCELECANAQNHVRIALYGHISVRIIEWNKFPSSNRICSTHFWSTRISHNTILASVLASFGNSKFDSGNVAVSARIDGHSLFSIHSFKLDALIYAYINW